MFFLVFLFIREKKKVSGNKFLWQNIDIINIEKEKVFFFFGKRKRKSLNGRIVMGQNVLGELEKRTGLVKFEQLLNVRLKTFMFLS